ncbi:hypothetical protein [Rhodococcus qingshengii]|uniref:hypothetical protein n=1 Tax=Rhodococcus qingshengii TaxID=334542 RepID=UPI00034C1A2B|nr:hypothetical protein [Rhodococcus qingshengii]
MSDHGADESQTFAADVAALDFRSIHAFRGSLPSIAASRCRHVKSSLTTPDEYDTS